MDLSKTVYAIVGVLVAVLIVATVAVPVVDDVQSQQIVKYNNGNTFNYFADFDDGFDLSKSSGSTSVTVNGHTYAANSMENILLLTPEIVISLTSAGAVYIASSDVHRGIADDESFSAHLEKGVFTYSINGVETTIEGITSGFVVSPDEGRYTSAVLSGNPIYINQDSDLYVGVYSSAMGALFYYDGVMNGNADIQISKTLVNEDFPDLYKLDSVKFVGSTTVDVGIVLVPTEVIGHASPASGSIVALFGAAILVLFLVPVMMVVRMIAGRSD